MADVQKSILKTILRKAENVQDCKKDEGTITLTKKEAIAILQAIEGGKRILQSKL